MNTVQVKNTVIGEGRPKICIPIVGETKTDILEEAKKIKAKEDRIEDLVRVGMSLNEARQQK